jgi:hypothetical protein
MSLKSERFDFSLAANANVFFMGDGRNMRQMVFER